MPRDIRTILELRVPVIVRLGHRKMTLDTVLALAPGAIVELPQVSDRPLDLMVNNKVIGQGSAVKIGENFGLRVAQVGDPADRAAAMFGTPETSGSDEAAPADGEESAEPVAAAAGESEAE